MEPATEIPEFQFSKISSLCLYFNLRFLTVPVVPDLFAMIQKVPDIPQVADRLPFVVACPT